MKQTQTFHPLSLTLSHEGRGDFKPPSFRPQRVLRWEGLGEGAKRFFEECNKAIKNEKIRIDELKKKNTEIDKIRYEETKIIREKNLSEEDIEELWLKFIRRVAVNNKQDISIAKCFDISEYLSNVFFDRMISENLYITEVDNDCKKLISSKDGSLYSDYRIGYCNYDKINKYLSKTKQGPYIDKKTLISNKRNKKYIIITILMLMALSFSYYLFYNLTHN